MDIGFPLGLSSLKYEEFTRFINLLNIYTYERLKYVFFYDCLTEVAKYYLIYKSINDEINDENKLFSNRVLMINKKSKLFEKLLKQ